MSEVIERLKLAAEEMLLGGQHEGRCLDEEPGPDDSEDELGDSFDSLSRWEKMVCVRHVAANERRRTELRAALDAMGPER